MAIGRNDPCPCRSGGKYKACCQARDERWARRLRAWDPHRGMAECHACGARLPLRDLRVFPDLWFRARANSMGEPARACAQCEADAKREEGEHVPGVL